MLKMKDLLEEGRKIQETFKKNVMVEAITPAYAEKVNKEYIELANKVGRVGKFTFDSDVESGPSQWGATTKSGAGDLIVFFKPFSHPESERPQPKFEVSVWTMYPNSRTIESEFGGSSDSRKKFIKAVNPSNDPKKDAALALDYIKKFLISADMTNFLKSLR